MALGRNRQYNSFRGIPVDVTEIDGVAADDRSKLIRGCGVSINGMGAVIENIPRAAASTPGLPRGTDAEQYIVDLCEGIWNCYVVADGADVAAGTTLSHVAHAQVATPGAQDPRIGDFTNNPAGLTPGNFTAVEGVVARESVTDGTRKLIPVYIGATGMTAT